MTTQPLCHDDCHGPLQTKAAAVAAAETQTRRRRCRRGNGRRLLVRALVSVLTAVACSAATATTARDEKEEEYDDAHDPNPSFPTRQSVTVPLSITLDRSLASLSSSSRWNHFFPTSPSSLLSSLSSSSLSYTLPEFWGPAGPDYAGLSFDTLRFRYPHQYRRNLDPHAPDAYEEERYQQMMQMDYDAQSDWEVERYDDLESIAHAAAARHHHRSRTTRRTVPECRSLKWAEELHPTCNAFHELSLDRAAAHRHDDREDDPDEDHDQTKHFPYNQNHRLQSYQPRYLAHGQYRDTWLLESLIQNTPSGLTLDNVVLKALRLVDELDYTAWYAVSIAREAIVMERTSSRPQTMNIYGHCFTSTLVEQGWELSQRIVEGTEYHGRGRIRAHDLWRVQQESSNDEDVYPFNNFTKEEKLTMAIQMAEGLAVLHGHDEGVIVNDDVHPDQWLFNKDGLVKFNDFNNARILAWNESGQGEGGEEGGAYCKYDVWVGGDYRSPEQMKGMPVDEKSDVWPFGAIVMGLLSGLFPFYEVWDRYTIESIIKQGNRPYLDERYSTRSFIEGRLYEVMEACWEVDPDKRISIFEVVAYLHEARDILAHLKETGEWIPERDDPRPQQESLLAVRARMDRERELVAAEEYEEQRLNRMHEEDEPQENSVEEHASEVEENEEEEEDDDDSDSEDSADDENQPAVSRRSAAQAYEYHVKNESDDHYHEVVDMIDTASGAYLSHEAQSEQSWSSSDDELADDDELNWEYHSDDAWHDQIESTELVSDHQDHAERSKMELVRVDTMKEEL